MVERVEAASAAQSSLIETIVNLALDGDALNNGPGMTTEPEQPTMGLLDETLRLLEQFAGEASASMQSGTIVTTFPSSSDAKVIYTVEMTNGIALCNCPGFSYGGNCKHAREVLRSAK